MPMFGSLSPPPMQDSSLANLATIMAMLRQRTPPPAPTPLDANGSPAPNASPSLGGGLLGKIQMAMKGQPGQSGLLGKMFGPGGAFAGALGAGGQPGAPGMPMNIDPMSFGGGGLDLGIGGQ